MGPLLTKGGRCHRALANQSVALQRSAGFLHLTGATLNHGCNEVGHFRVKVADVEESAEIGAGSKVWHYSHVMPGARLGKNCILGQNVYVGRNVVIGNNVKVQNNVSVYERVELEDGVFCGPSMVFTNVVNPRSEIERKSEFKATLVKQGATLGANCTILCGYTIGRYAFIGASAVVTKDVPAYALMVGVPAKQIGWMTRHGERLQLPLEGESEAACPATGDRYQLKNGIVTCLNP